MMQFPRLNAGTLKHSFVLRQAKRRMEDIFGGIGHDNIQYLMERGKQIKDYVPEETLDKYMKIAPQYKWAAETITDEDFYDILPKWMQKLVEGNENGREWMKAQIEWMRGIFE